MEYELHECGEPVTDEVFCPHCGLEYESENFDEDGRLPDPSGWEVED